MYPLWDLAVEPVLQAARARRIVEIGALRGETTARMLDGLGADAELHVIDPVPVFDPTEHERQFPGRYFFHRDLSLNVLDGLPPMDAALVDGDHNWYTVYHELQALRNVTRRAGLPLPVLVLHDVGWPYGRRDLYYVPEQIPEEFRQPHAKKGMFLDQSELADEGGLNPENENALHEGGPRNGVMTALEDFLAEHDQPVRTVVLPVYFGLAIVAEERVLDARPELRRVLDDLEIPPQQLALTELTERIRLESLVVQHGVFYSAQENTARVAHLYLDLLKGALLNEHHVEQELRLHQLARSIETGQPPFGESMRDPSRRLVAQVTELRARRRSGRPVFDDSPTGYFALTEIGRTRLDAVESCLDTIRTTSVAGDLVQCGTGRGGVAVFLRAYLDAYKNLYPRVFVADAFRAAPPGKSTSSSIDPGSLPGGGVGFPELWSDVNAVRDGFHRFGLLDGRVRFLQGPYRDTLPSAPIDKIALLHLGETVGEEAGEILDALYDRITNGGYVVVDQYARPECRAAVDAFRARHDIREPLERHDGTAVAWRKTAMVPAATDAADDPAAADEAPARPPVPLQPPLWIYRCDLTVAVVFHNMRREAARTLHSLSRSYQQGIEDLDYEVLVVDNGSDPDQRLSEEFVRSFGREFRLVDLGDEETPSPAVALNRAIAQGRGNHFAIMIDGAHVLTPGVLRFGFAGLQTYAPAVVATQQWYVGPGDQGDAVAQGYDQAAEDALFDRIGWPADGYKLFDIGHFIGERDWLDGLWESNCLFVPRTMLDQVGAFDERFDMPGGGYANLDLYERMSLAPDVSLVTILGEGSFHQVHGGTTTNLPDPADRHEKVTGYAKHFEELRGRAFMGHSKQLHFVGAMRPEAARTRARHRALPNLHTTPTPGGVPDRPQAISRELRAAFTEAYWSSLAWQDVSWLGHPVAKTPNDLFAYQELLSRVRPDWIVETGTGTGGRALFLASVCELLDHGRVVSVDATADPARPQHPRLTYVTGVPDLPDTLEAVRAIVGDRPNALVILGSRTTAGRTFAEFRLYETLVPCGSYVVVEDTIVNGHPVWPEHGPGPFEAVKGVANTRDDFAVDRTMDRLVPSFNPGGFLQRTRPPA